MRDLKAIKPLTYATRRLLAGDVFTPQSESDRKVLVALGKAAPVESQDSDLSALRSQYQAKFGKRPFMGWDADKLREKIAEDSAL
jgi:hypothetical protein